MAISNVEIAYVATGSLYCVFTIDDDIDMPDGIYFRFDDGDTPILSDKINIYPASYVKNKYITSDLSQPIAFATQYTVDVLIDNPDYDPDDELSDPYLTLHTAQVTLPAPGARRSPVLRQRLYELIYKGVQAGELQVQPFGTRQEPDTVNLDFLKSKGTFLEIEPGYITNIHYDTYNTSIQSVNIPINIYIKIDSEDDIQIAVEDMESVVGYLMGIDWGLNGFGLIQSSANFELATPEIDDERNSCKIEATLNIDMRRYLR